MRNVLTRPGSDPSGSHEAHAPREPAVSPIGGASALVGIAGLSAMALLLGVSPLSMWPFVISVVFSLCAVMLMQGRSTLGITVIGVVTGTLWVVTEAWRSGFPSFVGWFVPIASYTVLLLVLHHAGDAAADAYLVDALRSRNALYWITALGALEKKHKRWLGRNPDAWERFLKEKKR